MRLRDDYRGDMANGRFSEGDIELLFAGLMPEDARLAALAPLAAALRDQARAPSEETVSRVAQAAAETVRSSRAPEKASSGPRALLARAPSWRFAAALGASLLVVGLGSGVAVAADGAAPGDPLYGLDLALEEIGIGDGSAAERIREANVLLERGRVGAALVHLAHALESEQDDEAMAAALDEASDQLRAAAVAVTSSGQERSEEVRLAVAEMLDWMAQNDVKGRDFGQGVAERARGIAKPASPGRPDNPGENQGQGNGPPEDPGPPDETPAGPPTGNGGSGGGRGNPNG